MNIVFEWQEQYLTSELGEREMLYEVQCLKSSEDMIPALAGQFK